MVCCGFGFGATVREVGGSAIGIASKLSAMLSHKAALASYVAGCLYGCALHGWLLAWG